MNDYEIFRQEIGEILTRFGRWMVFIEIVQYTALALGIIALVLLAGRIAKERITGKRGTEMNRKVDLREEKAELGAPCIFIVCDRKTGRYAAVYPQVDCEHRCRNCGWNPGVKARRLKGRIG